MTSECVASNVKILRVLFTNVQGETFIRESAFQLDCSQPQLNLPFCAASSSLAIISARSNTCTRK